MKRFEGTIKKLADVSADCYALEWLIAWVKNIPLEEWPQQSTTELKPAMVSNLEWRGFGEAMWPLVRALGFDDNDTYQHMVSVVMPGHFIPPHRDQQADYWATRIHVPLLGNDKSYTVMDGKRHVMKVGEAYMVNVLDTHAVENKGKTPRIHFMFDVRQS